MLTMSCKYFLPSSQYVDKYWLADLVMDKRKALVIYIDIILKLNSFQQAASREGEKFHKYVEQVLRERKET
jgi:hypothetical protein